MVRIAIVTYREKPRFSIVCSDVRWFHTIVTILTISYCVPRQAFHPFHLAHASAGILNKKILRPQFPDEFQYMLSHHITKFSILTDRFQTSSLRVLSPVVADSCNGKSGAVWACPYHIRFSEQTQDIICCYKHARKGHISIFSKKVSQIGSQMIT